MDKSLIVILLVVITTFDIMADQAPPVVEKYYKTLESMYEAPSDSLAVEYRTDLMECFKGKKKGSIWVPNDFINWGYENELKIIPANTYSTRFYELSFKQKRLRMTNYVILNSGNISEVEIERFKNKSSFQYIQTVIRKTLSDGKVSKTYSDTLLVENGKIVMFRNALYIEGEDVDTEALRVLAASYYSTKQFDKAYHTYEQIIQLDPKNSNAYYRLAILTHYGEGCKQNDNKATTYAEKAKSLRNSEDTRRLVYYLKSRQRI